MAAMQSQHRPGSLLPSPALAAAPVKVISVTPPGAGVALARHRSAAASSAFAGPGLLAAASGLLATVAAGGRRRPHALTKAATARLAAAQATDDATLYLELMQWLTVRKAYVSDAVGLVTEDPVAGETGNQAKERGVVATREVINGELLLEIPVSCCMTAQPGNKEAVGADPEVAAALETAGITHEDAALALALHGEQKQGEASAWWPYVRMLQAEHSFPLFFETADLEALENTALRESLEVTSRAVAVVAKKWGFVDEELRAAWQLVRSRRFGSELGTCMIPLGDFLNHTCYPSCAWEPPTAQQPEVWKLRAKLDLAPGDSINFSYCEDPNHLLLSTIGVVLKDNPHSRIMARPRDLRKALLGVCNPQSPEEFAIWRREELERQVPEPKEEGAGMSMFLVGRQPGGLQWNPLWLDLVGLAITDSPDGQHWSAALGGTERYLAALEEASWSLFPRRLEDDPGAASETSWNQVLAAELRCGQKSLLSEALASLRTRLEAQGG